MRDIKQRLRSGFGGIVPPVCDEAANVIESLESDAARYRWLKETAPDLVATIAWRVKAACAYGDPDSAIDAARASTHPPGCDD